jgi:heterodisulfide reductase subunit A-like polyferredoxin
LAIAPQYELIQCLGIVKDQERMKMYKKVACPLFLMELNKMITKEDIEKKLEIVYRQMEHCKYDDWIPKVRERELTFYFPIMLSYIQKQLGK